MRHDEQCESTGPILGVVGYDEGTVEVRKPCGCVDRAIDCLAEALLLAEEGVGSGEGVDLDYWSNTEASHKIKNALTLAREFRKV